MKKLAALLLVMALFLCSCGKVPEEAQSLVDTSMAEQLYFSGLLGDWDCADELDPDRLVLFYFLSTQAGEVWEQYYQADPEMMRYPRELCESYVTGYFDISEELLRAGSQYDSEALTYDNTCMGYGGVSFIDSVTYEKKGKNVLATVYRHIPVDEGKSDPGPLPAYIITLTQTDDGWRISSCEEVSAENS